MESNNVIQFPFKGSTTQTQLSLKDVVLSVNMIKHSHISQTLETIIPMLFNNMEIAGFNIVPLEEDGDDEHIKDGALIVEAIRSLMCKYYEIEHPFQELSEKLFIAHDDGSFALAKTLIMDFKESDDEEESELES